MKSTGMDIQLRNLGEEQGVVTVSSTKDCFLSVSKSSSSGYAVTLSKWERSPTGTLMLGSDPSRWNKFGGKKLGPCAAFDSGTGTVLACLRDRKRVVALSEVVRGDVRAQDLEFESPLFKLTALSGLCGDGENDVIVAISTSGEICLLRVGSTPDEIKQRRTEGLPVTEVLATAMFSNDHVVIAGLEDGNVVIYPVRFTKCEDFDSLAYEVLPQIRIPQPRSSVSEPRRGGEGVLLGFALDESCCYALYAGGYLHLTVAPKQGSATEPRSLATWYGNASNPKPPAAVLLERPTLAVRLSAGSPEMDAGTFPSKGDDLPIDTTSILHLGEGYVAVAYGQFVSIWDPVYKVGHALARLNGLTNSMCMGPGPGKAVIGCNTGLKEFRVQDIEERVPPSLAVVLRRKGNCDAIILGSQSLSGGPRVQSQPLTVSATGLAAEGGGGTAHVFDPLLSSQDKEEDKLVRAVLSPQSTASPEAVARLTEEYTTKYRKVRRGNYGEPSELGLAKLPSERLAAVSVARCLYELHFGNTKYVVPLIDMVGTGVVSSESVLAVLGASESWGPQIGQPPPHFVSIVDPLFTSANLFSALEAIVLRVSDLPEADVVRILQFVVRFIEANEVDDGNGEVSPHPRSAANTKLKPVWLAQARRLVAVCLSSFVSRTRVIDALRLVPFADVMSLLRMFNSFLNDAASPTALKLRTEVPAAPPSVRRGFFFKRSFGDSEASLYRGVGVWLENDKSARDPNAIKRTVRGCIEWTGHVIDAHLQTLMMDESGRSLISRLLENVRQRRKEVQVLKGLQGLTSHLVGRRPIPSREDPLYSSALVTVPAFAALQ